MNSNVGIYFEYIINWFIILTLGSIINLLTLGISMEYHLLLIYYNLMKSVWDKNLSICLIRDFFTKALACESIISSLMRELKSFYSSKYIVNSEGLLTFKLVYYILILLVNPLPCDRFLYTSVLDSLVSIISFYLV